MPAVVAIGSLMPIRGVKFDPLIRIQSYPLDQSPLGEWWTHRGRSSNLARIESEMKKQFGKVYWEVIDEPSASDISDRCSSIDKIPYLRDFGLSPEYVRDCEVLSGPLDVVQFIVQPLLSGEEGSQFGYRPICDRNEYGHKIDFRPDELQPVDLSSVHHIQDRCPQVPTDVLKAELNRICKWGA